MTLRRERGEVVAGPSPVEGGRPRPERTNEFVATITVTTGDVFVRVVDRLAPGSPELWLRDIVRPAGKSEAECVGAALSALRAGLACWQDLIGAEEPPLPIPW